MKWTEWIQNTSWDNLRGRDCEAKDRILRPFPGQCMTFDTLPGSLLGFRALCDYQGVSTVFFQPALLGRDSCLPHPGWEITFPHGNGEEGKVEVARNRRADESSSCLCWIGPGFCLTSSRKWGFAQIKLWQDEIKRCFTVPHVTCSD